MQCQDALIGQIVFFYRPGRQRRDLRDEPRRLRSDPADQQCGRRPLARGVPRRHPDLFRTNRDGNAEIYSMNADGSGPVNLTNSPPRSASGLVAGRHRASRSRAIANGDQEIFVMNADGTGAVNLSNSPGSDEANPAWSPDGSRITVRHQSRRQRRDLRHERRRKRSDQPHQRSGQRHRGPAGHPTAAGSPSAEPERQRRHLRR